jgi:hypothetical protein
LTKLPLPPTGAPFLLYENPNKMDDVPVCKSKGTMDFYSGRSGSVSVAVAWYSAQLAKFIPSFTDRFYPGSVRR